MKKNILRFIAAATLILTAVGCEKGEEESREKNSEAVLSSVQFNRSENSSLLTNQTATALGSKNFLVTVSKSVSLSSLVPTFTVSEGATIRLGDDQYEPGTPIDFSKLRTITVVSEDQMHSNKYKIIVKNGRSDLDQKVYDFMAKYSMKGVSVSIMKGENIAYEQGYGFAYEEENIVVEPTFLFRLASISKTFTTLCIMKLYEQGKLTIDDKIFGEGGILNDYYPLPDGADERIKQITVRNCLQHNTGWTYDPEDYAFISDYSRNIDWRIQQQLKAKLTYDPDTHYSYFNMGFGILGRVIEVLSGKDFEQYLRDEVLAPMGVTDVHLGDIRNNRRKNECIYYSQSSTNPYNHRMFTIGALGGLIASTHEMMSVFAHIDGRDDVPDTFKPETLKMMYTTINKKANNMKALGWSVNSSVFEGCHYHTGNLAGTATVWAGSGNFDTVKSPYGTSGAILCNSRSYKDDFDADLNLLLSALLKATY